MAMAVAQSARVAYVTAVMCAIPHSIRIRDR